MNKLAPRITPAFLAAVLAAACSTARRDRAPAAELLPRDSLRRVEALAASALPDFAALCVGLVKAGAPVLVKAWGEGSLEARYPYASVSKPVTSMIVQRLLQEGRIRSLDDDIGGYAPRFRDRLPEAYRGSGLTFRQLLLHTSGLPHLQSAWAGEVFDLQFRPGSRHSYSTMGYGILGQVLADRTGLSFAELLRRHIAGPIGAASFMAPGNLIDPGAFIHSNIEDMARFAAGVMNGTFVPLGVLEKDAFRAWITRPPYGLGWGVEGEGTDDWTVFHGGSNGLPKAFLIIKPRRKTAVCLLATCRTAGNDAGVGNLARALLEILE